MLDPARVPDRLEQRVAEAQREDVLYRLLAQIMVDAEGAVLGEDLGDGIVDLAARLQVVTERIFEPDPFVRAREPRRFEPFDRRPEQRRRGRQEDREEAEVRREGKESVSTCSGRRDQCRKTKTR